LRLRIHETRTQVLPVSSGIPWLGFVVYPTHRMVKARKVRNAHRRLRALRAAYHAGEISFARCDASVSGWIAHVAQADSWGLRRKVLDSKQDIFPVVDKEQRFRGIVTLDSLRSFLFEEGLVDVAVARDLATDWDEVLTPDQTLDDARRALARCLVTELPVIDPQTKRVRGILREHDLHAAYNQSVERME
jgi:CBS-domain-containing membrane protein